MAVASTVLVKKVHLAAARFCTLFRVNTGTGWVSSAGKPTRVSKPTKIMMMPGDVLLRSARPLVAGLTNGGGDLIGWKSEIITPEMIGEKFARFVSVEVKYGSGTPKPNQINFANQINQAGGIAGIVWNEEQAISLVK